jgi:hypothetical protein
MFFLVGNLTTRLLSIIYKIGLKILLEKKGEKPRGIICMIQAYVLPNITVRWRITLFLIPIITGFFQNIRSNVSEVLSDIHRGIVADEYK